MATDLPSAWDAAAAIGSCALLPWAGDVWRCHGRKYPGDSAGGSLVATGRFHRGRDRFPEHDTWPALYTALAPHVALGEQLRHTSAAALSRLNTLRMSRLSITLQVVLVACVPAGCHDLVIPGIYLDDLCHPSDYRVTHQIGNAARAIAEALMIPSCTRFPDGNLIIFPDQLHCGSKITILDTVDPELSLEHEPSP